MGVCECHCCTCKQNHAQEEAQTAMIIDAMVFTNASHFSANRYNECNAKQETTSSLSSIKSAAVEEILRIHLHRMPFDCLLLEFRFAVGSKSSLAAAMHGIT